MIVSPSNNKVPATHFDSWAQQNRMSERYDLSWRVSREKRTKQSDNLEKCELIMRYMLWTERWDLLRARYYIQTDDEMRSQKDCCFLGYRTGSVLKTLCRIIKFPEGWVGGKVLLKLLFVADYFMTAKHLLLEPFDSLTYQYDLPSRQDFLNDRTRSPFCRDQKTSIKRLKFILHLNAEMEKYWIKINLYWFNKSLSVSRIL